MAVIGPWILATYNNSPRPGGGGMESEHRSAISVVFVLLVAGTMTAVAVAPEPQPPALQAENTTGTTTISVSATGDVQAEPDVAVVHLESTATATEPQTATERLAANVSTLRDALQEANVSADRIRTTQYNLFEPSELDERRPGENVTRYRAEQVLAVEVENTSRVGAIVDLAVANGATGVRGVEFTLSEDVQLELRNRALEEAMTNARSQAETLAATEDVRITGVRSISTDAGGPRPFFAADAAAATESGTQIDGGPVTVHATVQVAYNATG